MPLTVFDIMGVPYNRRDPIEHAVVSAGEASAVASVRVIITGAQGFHRQVAFAADEEPAASTEMVRTTLDDE
jgi:hypothetical protein